MPITFECQDFSFSIQFLRLQFVHGLKQKKIKFLKRESCFHGKFRESYYKQIRQHFNQSLSAKILQLGHITWVVMTDGSSWENSSSLFLFSTTSIVPVNKKKFATQTVTSEMGHPITMFTIGKIGFKFRYFGLYRLSNLYGALTWVKSRSSSSKKK